VGAKVLWGEVVLTKAGTGAGEVVEGAGGEVNEHHSMKAEHGDAASGSGGGRRRLAPIGPRWQRSVERSGGGRVRGRR
jgi:hypothetical protein